jgi:hypothetical protein
MSDRSSLQTAPSAPAGKMPGEVARGLLSLWIIIHFVGILLAIATSNELANGQGEMGRSQLLSRLKSVPPVYQYINALWFDVPYDFYLADGGPLDGDFSLRCELHFKDGKTETLNYPTSDISFGERRERLARMALSVARAFDAGDSKIAAMIGKGVLTQYQADELKLFVIRHQPLSVEDARSTDTAQRDPSHRRTFVQPFEATISLNLTGDAQVSMKQEALDVAPVNRGGASSKAPETNKRGKLAAPLPQPELPKSSTIPKLPFRPTDTTTDPLAPPK